MADWEAPMRWLSGVGDYTSNLLKRRKGLAPGAQEAGGAIAAPAPTEPKYRGADVADIPLGTGYADQARRDILRRKKANQEALDMTGQ